MARTIKLGDNEMQAIEREASLNNRSLSGQAEHWIRIGRAIERSPNFNYEHIKAALSSLLAFDELSGPEQEAYMAEFYNAMTTGPAAEVATYYRTLGGPGIDDDDPLAVNQ